jgi:hypothetical protein
MYWKNGRRSPECCAGCPGRSAGSHTSAGNFGSLLPVGGHHGDLFTPRIIQFGLRRIY